MVEAGSKAVIRITGKRSRAGGIFKSEGLELNQTAKFHLEILRTLIVHGYQIVPCSDQT